MKRVQVEVRPDHLERLTAGRPVSGLAELIWNALDADATHVEVKIEENQLEGISSVRVTDNGSGLPYKDAVEAFGSLGGSWKARARRSPGGRQLHGRAGEGRFRAFAIGGHVQWSTRWLDDGSVLECLIQGEQEDIKAFGVSEPVKSKGKPGTTVTISNITNTLGAFRSKGTTDYLTEEFALYLREHRDVQVIYDGDKLDPSLMEDHVEDIVLEAVELSDGSFVEADLTVIEWTVPVERSLVLCDSGGFVLARKSPGIQARGFQFTAYLKSDFLRTLDEAHLLDMEDLEPRLDAVLSAAKIALREHFRKRQAEEAGDLVEQWKERKIYPYRGPPRNVVEEVERQMFDVLALNINDYLPDFERSDDRSKKLSFHMLRAALEQSPSSVQRIIQDVLELPKEKQTELAGLLEKTSLTAIISATKTVTDRLDFLKALEVLVFEAESKKRLLERQQLHRILAENTWVFGEEFNLSVDDQSMAEVLRKHEQLLGREPTIKPVPTIEGGKGIVDLMLSRVIRRGKADEREHLVIELKRPSKRLDAECLTQIETYAYTVADDERFRDTNTKWIFWLVGNEMAELARKKVAKQKDRPDGLLGATDDGRVSIWVRTWGQVIEACQGRLKFFEDRLAYMAKHDEAVVHLQGTYEKYLPTHLKGPKGEGQRGSRRKAAAKA